MAITKSHTVYNSDGFWASQCLVVAFDKAWLKDVWLNKTESHKIKKSLAGALPSCFARAHMPISPDLHHRTVLSDCHPNCTEKGVLVNDGCQRKTELSISPRWCIFLIETVNKQLVMHFYTKTEFVHSRWHDVFYHCKLYLLVFFFCSCFSNTLIHNSNTNQRYT